MDPFTIISAGIAIGGLAMQIFGGSEAEKAAKQENAANVDIVNKEQQIEGQKRQQMELDANRKTMQELRNAQQARSLALASAAGKGAQFSSSLSAGYGQISGQANTDLLGIAQNRRIGENVFDLNAQISQDKIALANAKTAENSANAISGFGKDISGASGSIGKFVTQGYSYGAGLFGSPGGGYASQGESP